MSEPEPAGGVWDLRSLTSREPPPPSPPPAAPTAPAEQPYAVAPPTPPPTGAAPAPPWAQPLGPPVPADQVPAPAESASVVPHAGAEPWTDLPAAADLDLAVPDPAVSDPADLEPAAPYLADSHTAGSYPAAPPGAPVSPPAAPWTTGPSRSAPAEPSEPPPGEPPWSVPQQSAPPSAVPGGGRLPMIVVGAALAVLLVVGAIIVVVRRGETGAPTAAAPTPTAAGQAANLDPVAPATGHTPDPVTTPATGGPATEPPVETAADPEAEAVAELDTIYRQDRGTVGFHGQYVAQIASKYPGIDDPLQTAADGTHVFQATDILAEHKQLRVAHDSAEHPIVLLKSTDYGKRQTIDGHFLWVTFAVGAFGDRQSVRNWCAAQFADLTTAERENQCAVRTLAP
jgi:hypothetical protein